MHRALYSQVGAAVSGISHVLTGRVIEFIMEALEKLNMVYSQPPLPQMNVSSRNHTQVPWEPSRSLDCRPGELEEDGDPHNAELQRGWLGRLPTSLGSCPCLTKPGQCGLGLSSKHCTHSRGRECLLNESASSPHNVILPGFRSVSFWNIRRSGLNLGKSSELYLN